MTVSPRGNTWEVYVKRGGKRFRVSAQTEAQGKAMEAEIVRCLDAGREPDLAALKRLSASTGGKTLREAIDFLVPVVKGWRNDPRTPLINLNVCARILGDGRSLDSIDKQAVYELVLGLRERGLSDTTINRKMSALRVLLSEAQELGWCKAPPKLPHSKEGKGRKRFLTEDEEKQLLAAAVHLGNPEMADFWAFLLDTGARHGEARHMEWSHVIGAQVTFYGEDEEGTKNGEIRTVPLVKRAGSILARRRNYPKPWPFSYAITRHWWDRVKVYLGKTDDKEWVQHILRHTCASRLVQRGAPLQRVMEVMGHKSMQMTLRYAHLAPSNLTDTMALLEPKAPVAELVDADGLGPSAEEHGGSTPSGRTSF